MREWIVVAVLIVVVGTVTSMCVPRAECGQYGCAGMICDNNMGCVFPCSCVENGTGPGQCVSPR